MEKDKALLNNVNERNVSMDILRILAMAFIVVIHLVGNNMGLNDIENSFNNELEASYYVSAFVQCFVVVGVNLFFLISGYFGIKLKVKKVISLLAKVYILWIISHLICLGINGVESYGDGGDFAVALLLGISKYWFVAVYLLLTLVSPLLNLIADKLDEKGAGYFVFATLVLYTVAGFVADFFYPYFGTGGGYLPAWASVVYIYGRLISKRRDRLPKSKLGYGLAYLTSCLVNFALVATLIALKQGKWATHMFSYNNVLVFVGAVALFMVFVRTAVTTNEKASKGIGFVAKYTLGVYLVHSNNPLLSPVRAFLLNLLPNNLWWAKYFVLIPNAVILFAIGIIVDFVYETTIGKGVGFLAGKLDKGVTLLSLKISNCVKNKFLKDEIQENPQQKE